MADEVRRLRREIVNLIAVHQGPSAAFDRLADFFRADTGMLPPGKDDVLGHPYEQRIATFTTWRKENEI